MNILQIVPELNVGGVETGTLELAAQLVKLGHKSVVISSGGELVDELKSCGAVHYQLAVEKKSLLSMIKMIPRVAEIIKREQIDIVHARSRVPAWIAYFACRKSRAVFITTCHGYYRKHFLSSVMGWGKRVIVISNVIGRHMIDDFAVPRERIRLIPRSVDLDKFKYVDPQDKKRKELNVGIIGRITPIKGHLHFIKAMARVYRILPHIKIWIVGDAPASKQNFKEQAEVLVRRLGLWHCTEFLGTQRDIPAVMAHLDVLVLATTTHEAFGRVIVEAQASGVPVVATRVGGVIDIIDDDKTGLLVPPADTKSMADAIIRIHKDKQLARRLAEAAYRKLKEKYNLQLMIARTLETYQDALQNFKILVVKISSLGDVILSTASLKAIREKFAKGYRISVLVGEGSKEVLMRCPYIDELLVCDFKGRDKGIKAFLRLAGSLSKKNFDIAVDLQNNRKSHLLSFLSMAPERYGYDNKKFGFLLNRSLKDEKPAIGPIEHQFRVLKLLGVETLDKRLNLWPSKADELYVEEFLRSQWLSARQKLVGINISASLKWETKAWPLSHIASLCEELSRRDIRAVVTGTAKDIPAVNSLIGMLKGTKPINACGKTSVNQLACLISKCSAYVSADSASLHIAASQNVPFIALFGPTDPARHMPEAENCILINKGLACSPCYKPKCRRKECMKLISPQEVIEALDKLIK